MTFFTNWSVISRFAGNAVRWNWVQLQKGNFVKNRFCNYNWKTLELIDFSLICIIVPLLLLSFSLTKLIFIHNFLSCLFAWSWREIECDGNLICIWICLGIFFGLLVGREVFVFLCGNLSGKAGKILWKTEKSPKRSLLLKDS